jgi:hypothetical protein
MQIDEDLNKQITLYGSTMVAVVWKILRAKTKLSIAFLLGEVIFAILVAVVFAPALQSWCDLTDKVTIASACIMVMFSTKLFTRVEEVISGKSKLEKGGGDEPKL